MIPDIASLSVSPPTISSSTSLLSYSTSSSYLLILLERINFSFFFPIFQSPIMPQAEDEPELVPWYIEVATASGPVPQLCSEAQCRALEAAAAQMHPGVAQQRSLPNSLFAELAGARLALQASDSIRPIYHLYDEEQAQLRNLLVRPTAWYRQDDTTPEKLILERNLHSCAAWDYARAVLARDASRPADLLLGWFATQRSAGRIYKLKSTGNEEGIYMQYREAAGQPEPNSWRLVISFDLRLIHPDEGLPRTTQSLVEYHNSL